METRVRIQRDPTSFAETPSVSHESANLVWKDGKANSSWRHAGGRESKDVREEEDVRAGLTIGYEYGSKEAQRLD